MSTPQSRLTTYLAASFAVQATGLAMGIFLMSRADHDMKLLGLGAAITQTTALMSTASTMLVGKDFSSHGNDPSELPPGSVQTEKTTVQTPPIIPNPTQPTGATA